MLAIWRQHWRVVIDRKPWNEQIAWSTYLNQPVPTITEQKAKPEWYSYTAEPTIDHFVSERLEMKAKSREMEKYKRGFIDEVQWTMLTTTPKWCILTRDSGSRDNTFPPPFLYTYHDLIIFCTSQ
jgi:hypothetical protein